MLRLGTEKADGVMVTDMPLGYLAGLVARIRAELAEARRDPTGFVLSNWSVWNVQETRAEAERLARRQLAFRLYYIREVAASIGLGDAEARELAAKQAQMLRAIYSGGSRGLRRRRSPSV